MPALGHMLTALTAGFPLTVPVHLYIAAQMAGYAAVLWWLSDKGNAGSVRMIAAGVLVSLLNGVLAAASIIPFFGKAAFIGLLAILGSCFFCQCVFSDYCRKVRTKSSATVGAGFRRTGIGAEGL